MQPQLAQLVDEVYGQKLRPGSAGISISVAARIAAVVFLGMFVTFQLGKRHGDRHGWATSPELQDRALELNATVERQAGELEFQRMYIRRLERVQRLSSQYGIAADLAGRIEDIALSEGVDPSIAFELVRLESEFNPRAVSSMGAVGLAQVMPATARWMEPGIGRADLFDPETNLRLGFRFLKIMEEQYAGDLRLALLAYNRGPGIVDRHLREGVDPANGYARTILRRAKANRAASPTVNP
jgi:soluble lytic murein transglycosylase-like protein